MEEAEQQVDTGLLNRSLASAGGQGGQGVLHVGTDTGRLLIHEHTGGANKIDRNLGAGFHRHKEPEVAATHVGITADFLGPYMPGGIITAEEYKEIVEAFPRLGFHDEVIRVMCGLCKNKQETTYDNPVHEFGIKYGLDGQGNGKEEFARIVELSFQ